MECLPCKLPAHAADRPLGLESGYTVGARRLAVFAGTNWSFDQSARYLKEFCNIELADNTIRALCQEEAPKMEHWHRNDLDSHKEFRAATGEIEFTCDGTHVNTTKGWKEMRLGIFSRRDLATPATPEEWGTRRLPRPHLAIAFAGIEEKDVFRAQWGYWMNRLWITDPGAVSVLADGAPWIWDSVFLEFSGKAQENLDIYHGLEYVSKKGDALFGPGTAESAVWLETMRRDLLEGGATPLLDRVRLLASVEESPGRLDALRLLENYLVYHSSRMNYRERLSEGRSIGSGQVEGACKNLVGRRLKQTGARWLQERVDRMATLCAVLYGDQWNDYWKTAT